MAANIGDSQKYSADLETIMGERGAEEKEKGLQSDNSRLLAGVKNNRCREGRVMKGRRKRRRKQKPMGLKIRDDESAYEHRAGPLQLAAHLNKSQQYTANLRLYHG